jgi:hypothetical protein
MSQDHIERIRGDLETIRHAVGLELPFGRNDVRGNVWLATCGALIAIWSALAPWDSRWVVAIPLGLAVLGGLWSTVRAKRNRATTPSRWREHRLAGMAALVFATMAVAYMRWERWTGMPREMVGAAGLFFICLGMLVVAMLDRRRRYYLGAAVPFMVLGLAIPLLTPNRVIIAVGLSLMFAGLAAASIQTLQLRYAGEPDGTH